MVAYELTYAQPTTCESVRVLLKLGGHEVTEKRVTKEQLDEDKIYVCSLSDGKNLYKQGNTILRALGATTEIEGKTLYPTVGDEMVGLEADTCVALMQELKGKCMSLIRDSSGNRAASLDKARDQVYPEYFGWVEEGLAKHGGPFQAGKYLTIGDLEFMSIFGFIHSQEDSRKTLEGYPKCLALWKHLIAYEPLAKARKGCGYPC